jgi:hypothetical protein
VGKIATALVDWIIQHLAPNIGTGLDNLAPVVFDGGKHLAYRDAIHLVVHNWPAGGSKKL